MITQLRVIPAIVLIGLFAQAALAHSEAHQEECPESADAACPEGITEHYVLHADEGDTRWFLGTLGTIKASSDQTGGALSLVEFICPPGFATPLHMHVDADEAFYVLEGTIRGLNGDQEWIAPAGSFVWLPRGIPHGFAVVGDENARVLTLVLPSGFDGFVRSVGDPAPERVLPPSFEPDVERLLAAAAQYGQEILGPLELPD